MNSQSVTFNFNKIYFIVSDLHNKSAVDLFSSTIERRCYLSNLTCEYFECTNKDSFISVLSTIAEDSVQILPYLHIECHGTPDGLTLANGDQLSWEDFGDLVTMINIKSKNNMFMSVAACYGGYFTLIGLRNITLGMEARAPLFGFIGPSVKISYEKIEIGFNKYFDSLLDDFDFGKAIQRLNKFSSYKPGYVIKTCQFQFREIVDQYLIMVQNNDFSTKLRFEVRINDLLLKKFRIDGLWPTYIEYLKAKAKLLDKSFYIQLLNDIGSKYFMFDLYPENKKRFSLINNIENWDLIIGAVR